MTKLIAGMKLFTGLTIAMMVVSAGYVGRSPISILPFAMVFSLLYFAGKQAFIDHWQKNSITSNLQLITRALPPTMLIQGVLCAILYLLGRGLGNVMGNINRVTFTLSDVYYALSILLFGFLMSWLISRLERHLHKNTEHTFEQKGSERHMAEKYELHFDDSPITLENFFDSVHYTHRRPGQDTPSEAATSSPEKIQAAEARLGIQFPPLLKALYMRQNGGMVYDMWVPAVANPTNDYEDWRGVFSHDYCYLTPLDKLDTLYDSYLLSMEEDEIEEGMQAGHIPKEAKRYIILCQRYGDTTFLDYSQSTDAPRVGIVDFQGIEEKDVWFDSFEQFFSALQRGTLGDD